MAIGDLRQPVSRVHRALVVVAARRWVQAVEVEEGLHFGERGWAHRRHVIGKTSSQSLEEDVPGVDWDALQRWNTRFRGEFHIEIRVQLRDPLVLHARHGTVRVGRVEDPADGSSRRCGLFLEADQEIPTCKAGHRYSLRTAWTPCPEDAAGEYLSMRLGGERGRRRVSCGERSAGRQVDGVRRLSSPLLQRETRVFLRRIPLRGFWE